jgi:hypothetical protein
MRRKITKSETTSIPGRWKVTLECGHVRWIARLNKPSRFVACGECQLRVNVSDREIEHLAIKMHKLSGDPIPWNAKAIGYRDVLRKEAAHDLGTKVSKAG